MVTSISFYLDNRKRVFAHPCYFKSRVRKLKTRVGKLKKIGALRRIFSKNVCSPWSETVPAPLDLMPYNRRCKLWIVHSEERVNSRRWLTDFSAKSDLQIAVVLNAIAQVSVRR